MQKISFTRREEQLIHFLWEAREPLTVGEIVDMDREHNWRETYLRVLLRSLERKGAVKCCETLKRNERYAKQYCTAISKEEYYAQLMMEGGADMGSLLEVAAAAFSKGKKEDAEETIRKLEQILEEYKAKSEDGE